MTNKQHAYDYVKNELTYDRPLFNFPDLSSENGNAFHFWPLIHSKLNELGFRKEARVFSSRMGFMKYSFDEILNLIDFYLDFNPENELNNIKNIVKEDEQYVYIKVKKELYRPENNLKQPSIFKVKDIETLRDMLDEDFSIKNCYGRTFLHYIDNPSLMTQFLKMNEEYQWIELIDLDNFNGSYLHSVTNLECFAILFKSMTDTNPIITDSFLFGKNSFGESAYDIFIKLLSEKSQSEESFLATFSNEDTISTISQIFTSLKKVNDEEFEFLKKQFYNNEKIQSYLENNDQVKQNLDKIFLFVNLENKLSSTENKVKNKNKI